MDMSMFQREQGYRLCLSVLEQLRDKGLLTAEEFVQARAVLIEKYDPPISALSLSWTTTPTSSGIMTAGSS